MKKRFGTLVLALVLAFALAVPAFAAYGRVACAAAMQTRSVTLPYLQGCDYAAAWAQAAEQSVAARYVQNILAQAKAVDFNSGAIYKNRSITSHNVLKTSVLTDEVERNWNLSEIAVQAQGLARTRYMDNTVDEKSNKGTVAYIGGDNLRNGSRAEESQNASVKASNDWLGEGKGDVMRDVIQTVFGKDLRAYMYISEGELWDIGSGEVPPEWKALIDLARDIFVDAQEGEKLPLGYLYRGNTAYTVVEQPDGSLQLTEYQLHSPATAQAAADADLIGELDETLYNVVKVENGTASRAVIDMLYQ